MSFGNTTAVLLVGSLLIPAASGQQAARYGTFSFVNVSAVSQPTIVSIDTAKLRPEGFKPGESTGKIGILAGQHQIEAIATGAQSAKETITVQEHASVTLIAYSIPHVDPATRQSTETLRLIVLPNPPKSAGKHFQLVYVSKRSEGEFIVNGSAKIMRAFQPLQIDGDVLRIESAGHDVAKFVARESGSFVVVIYDKADGSSASVVLPDYS